MKRILTIAILGITLTLACLGSDQPKATAVNWYEGPARIGQATPEDANWNS